MTDIRDELSSRGSGFQYSPEEEWKKMFFSKECVEKITILRRIHKGEWQTIGKDVRAPFLDSDQISTPAEISYKILFEHFRGTYC